MGANYWLAFGAWLVVLAALFAASCGSQQETGDRPLPSVRAETPVSSLGSETVDGAGFQYDYVRVPEGESLRKMIEYHQNIIVGEVLAETGVVYVDDLPKTGYAVRAEEVIAGDGISRGDEVILLVIGGPKKNGQWDPLQWPVKVGGRYLLFLADFRKIAYPGFGAFGFARFELTSDGRVVPNGSEDYPAVEAISGVSPEEVGAAWASPDRDGALLALARVSLDKAVQLIEATIAEAPLPEVPRWLQPYLDYWKMFPTPSPAPSPAPTPSPAAQQGPPDA